ncbi:MAG: SDR family oxidoreductase [Myxococcales bacterium]|nr:SDR family oxidoreductase [Myxococcales bacterium]MCB9648584.1 SDR family oxidoreductase [Deltaproteobacteria bacterium]
MERTVALITGGTRGLGLGIARALAARGLAVGLVYRSDDAAAQAAVSGLRAEGHAAVAVRADIGQAEAVARALDEVRDTLGPPVVLVNNAFRGGRTPQKTHEVPPAEFAEDISTNLVSAFLVTRACLPDMVAAGFGRVIFIGSLAARGEAGRVAYATAKAALTGLSATVAQEYARAGVTSNVINPGFIAAGAFERLPEQIQSRALATVPMRRAGDAAEVAALVAFLASQEAGYLTGQVIGLDGGAR